MKQKLKQFFCWHKWQVISKPKIHKKEGNLNFWKCEESCLKCGKNRIFQSWYEE